MNKLIIFLFIGYTAFSQQGDGGVPRSYKFSGDLKTIDKISFLEPDGDSSFMHSSCRVQSELR